MRISDWSSDVCSSDLAAAPPQSRLALAAQLGKANQSRIRLYDDEGRLALDSWSLTGETYRLRDPAREPLRKHAARLLDRAIDIVAAARSEEHTYELQSLMRISYAVF